jgi:hypothetical protein
MFSDLAKRLECGAFTAAFACTMRRRTEADTRPPQSGAEATALRPQFENTPTYKRNLIAP